MAVETLDRQQAQIVIKEPVKTFAKGMQYLDAIAESIRQGKEPVVIDDTHYRSENPSASPQVMTRRERRFWRNYCKGRIR